MSLYFIPTATELNETCCQTRVATADILKKKDSGKLYLKYKGHHYGMDHAVAEIFSVLSEKDRKVSAQHCRESCCHCMQIERKDKRFMACSCVDRDGMAQNQT